MDGARGELFCQRKYRQKFWKTKLPSAHCSWLQPYFAADCNLILNNFKGSSDPSHFIFEINIGRSRIVLCRIRWFPTWTLKIKWLGSELFFKTEFLPEKRPDSLGPNFWSNSWSDYLVQMMIRTHIFRKTRPNGPSETLSSMQLQVMLFKLSYFSKLESSSVVVFFENIFEEFLKLFLDEIFKCFWIFWNFEFFLKAFWFINSFRKWCSRFLCCGAPMTDVSLSRALLFIPLIRTLIRLASWHIFESLSAMWFSWNFFYRFLELFLELWTSENHFGIGTSVSIKPVDKLLPGGEYFCLDAELGWGRAHTAWSARRRYPQWGSARHEDPNTINTKLA